jgi:hypothetical protein
MEAPVMGKVGRVWYVVEVTILVSSYHKFKYGQMNGNIGTEAEGGGEKALWPPPITHPPAAPTGGSKLISKIMLRVIQHRL